MKKELITRLHKSFEEAVHHQGEVEYWLARELSHLMGYTQWRNFERVIEEAKAACENSGGKVKNHFAGVSKMVGIGSGSIKKPSQSVEDFYPCSPQMFRPTPNWKPLPCASRLCCSSAR
ncbi:MAG TPA: hypothetical protein VL997_03155 [Dyella sp.]|nr:hypothetical protein [Dyella sp.]